MKRGATCFFSAVVAVGLAGCPSSASREARSLVESVDRFRRAVNAEKPAAAAGVRAVACTDEEVCAAKTACLATVDPTAQALALQAEVTRGVSALEAKDLAADDPAAKALPEKLDQAERLLLDGRAALPACEERLDNLRHKYRF